MNQRENAISSINGLRTIIAQKIIVALNEHWNVAAFGNMSLNYRMILLLVENVKNCSHRILNICQNQKGYVPWTQVEGKKRFHRSEDCLPIKLKRIDG